MKILLLAALAFSQDSALRFEPAAVPDQPALAEPGRAGAFAAPTEAGDISFNQGDGVSLDFSENLAEEAALAAPRGRMLDERELRRHALKGKLGEDFTQAEDAGVKRGLSAVKFSANRRVAGAAIRAPAPAPVIKTPIHAPQQAASAPRKRSGGHRIGRIGVRGGARNQAAGVSLAAAPGSTAVPAGAGTLGAAPAAIAGGGTPVSASGVSAQPAPVPAAPKVYSLSMLGRLMTHNVAGYVKVADGAPAGQIWADGQELRDAEGNRAVMVNYDDSRALGTRHQWDVRTADGARYYDYSSPVVLDLDGDGVRMSRRSARFDADGDRRLDDVNDISSGDALLVFDADGDGVSGESGLETFGNVMDLDGDGKADGHADGFEALLALAREEGLDADGLLDASDLLLLGKRRGLALKRGGVLAAPVSFKKAGVASIALSRAASVTVENFDGQGNKTTRRAGAVFIRADGSKGAYEDVWFEFRGAGREQVAGVR